MSFNEERFPDDVAYGTRGGPGFSTNVTRLDSGAEERVGRWAAPRHSYNAAYGVRSVTQLSAVKQFYIAHQGPLIGFRFKDWLDYASTEDGRTPEWGEFEVDFDDQQIGVGDGSRTTFQLVKTYVSGVLTRTRNITKPVSGTVRVAKDGVEAMSGWTVDLTTGIVTFSVAPALGVVVTAGYEFDVPVRFAEEIDERFDISIDSFGDGSTEIPLIEVIDDGGVEDEYFYGGSNEIVIGANYTLSVSSGRAQLISASVAGLIVSLPDPASLPPGGPYFFVFNEGSETFTLKDHAGATLATLDADEGVEVVLSVASGGTKVWYAI